MESGAISDGQIKASSQYDVNHSPYRGRLNIQLSGAKKGAWSARYRDANQWLQIDLENLKTRVTRVATQGRSEQSQWVTKYNMQYSNDGENFQYHREEGQNDKEVK